MLAFVPEGSRDGSSLYSTITKTFFIDKKNAGNDNILAHSLFSRAPGDFHIVDLVVYLVRGLSQTTLTRFCQLLTTFPPLLTLVKNYVLHCTIRGRIF